ncbi:uncharacterized protein LOC126908386 isoform X2 [Daktulosphaira vitifoliae]|nr:uncharacterized protein LOC126908386 isoform X2 [Daktulosphaira vitifoliae]XP_050546360.1 uncharacterized protein LOC126908386 isoform X2 [Daktulosphaira vitifoliae]
MTNLNDAPTLLPSKPILFFFEVLLGIILIIPAIMWAILKKLVETPKKNVRGQVIVITGGGRGLGRELCLRFHRLGAKVACVDIDIKCARKTADIINEGGGVAKSYCVDITNREQIKCMHADIVKDLGPVDIIVNSAGIVMSHAYVNPDSDKLIEDIINVNLLGQFWVNREILPSMLERNSGQIVAISSMSSMSGLSGISSYAATKWATNGMMECLHNELKALNSNVVSTTVCPYFIDTNPELSDYFDLRIEKMSTSYAGEIIMSGILKNCRIFSVPNHFMGIVALASQFIGLPSLGPKVTSFLNPEVLSPWSVDLIRTKTRKHFPRPNETSRIRKHVLMISGCRSFQSVQFYSDLQGKIKVNSKSVRNVNYCIPVLTEERKKTINKIVTLQISGHYLNCTSFIRDGNILANWKMINLPEDIFKFNLDDVYNTVVEVMKDLPEGDVYLIENYVKMPSNVNVAGANLFYIKLQMLAMLIALINSKSNFDQTNNKVLLLKARLHARLFRIIVGTEIISSQTITESMLKGNFPEYITPIFPSIDAVLMYNSIKNPAIKELMSNGLMITIAFVDLILNSNPNSLQALTRSTRKKQKNNDL